MYKFSIIVPCFKIEKDISEIFNMLKPKSYNNYEVIFIDDCSPDNSFDKMKEAAKAYPNFSVYQPEKNGGPGLARNLGLQHANGEYIVFCDSDDKFNTEVLFDIESFLEGTPETDMLVSPHYTYKNGKKTITDKYKKYSHGTILDKCDVVLGNLAPWAKIYKASIIKENDISFPARRTGEDICFVVNYVSKCRKILKFDALYYEYIIQKNSITHKKTNDSMSTFDILQPIYHEHFPSIEIVMFAQNHLLTQAKHLYNNKTHTRELKAYFKEQNERYPGWINKINIEKQSLYRKLIYKAIYKNRPLQIKLIMFLRQITY